MGDIFEFESRKERNILLVITIAIVLLATITFYPLVKAKMDNQMIKNEIIETRAALSLESRSPGEYYSMFRCSCCDKSIEAECCGMAKQRKQYVDQLLIEGIADEEIIHQMVKKFGFDVLMDQSKEQEIRDYIKNKAPDNPPEIEIVKEYFNFGTIKQSDGIVTTTFDIKNSGDSDLIIENLDTSCMCTSASLIYENKEGPIFGMSMHGDNPKDFKISIPPGETAILKVYYDPMAHGKQKQAEQSIVRTVTIISNDPIDFQKSVRIELIQVK